MRHVDQGYEANAKAAEMYSREYHKVQKENQQLRAALVSARKLIEILWDIIDDIQGAQ